MGLTSYVLRLRAVTKIWLVMLLLSSAGAMAAQPNSGQVDLLAYMQSHEQAPVDRNDTTIPRYNRAKHFGKWVHQNPAKSCRDTREMVLERSDDPSVPVTFNKSGCSISGGLWHDPYTGTDISDAAQVQIDHVVPLAEVYYSGAYDWAPPIRCNYANFLANDFQLLAVSGHENMAKGDKGPDQYLPPNEAERCAYVSDWMKVKAIWNLSTTASEVAAIQAVVQKDNCDSSFTTMDAAELADQQAKAETPVPACAGFN